MKTKSILLCTVVLTLGACSAQSGPRYTPRPDVTHQSYTSTNRAEDHMDTKLYKRYEQREQCQHYRKPPRNYSDSCVSNMMREDKVVTKAQPATQKALPIVSSYTLLFDHDKSDIRGNEMATIDRAMREISRYNPQQVTVTGYTDSSGAADYNQALSREREQAVSRALLARGVESQTLEREARGEYDQAVQTADGVRNQENRRVVIDFRR